MVFRVVVRIFLNIDGLNQAELSQDSIVILVRVDKLVLKHHNELVDLEPECLRDLLSQLSDSLEIVHRDILLDKIRLQDDQNSILLVLIVLLLRVTLDSLFALVTIEEF